MDDKQELKQVAVRLPESFVKLLEKECIDKNLSKSNFFLELLSKHFGKRIYKETHGIKHPQDVFREAAEKGK